MVAPGFSVLFTTTKSHFLQCPSKIDRQCDTRSLMLGHMRHYPPASKKLPDDNYCETALSLRRLAEQSNVSSIHLGRLFRRHTGQTFHGYLHMGPAVIKRTPIVLDIAGRGFSLTDARNGVPFAITDTSTVYPVAWTSNCQHQLQVLRVEPLQYESKSGYKTKIRERTSSRFFGFLWSIMLA